MTFPRFTLIALFPQTIRAGAVLMLVIACLGFGSLAPGAEQHPLAGADECTTANPRGTHSFTNDLEIIGRSPLGLMEGATLCLDGLAPSS